MIALDYLHRKVCDRLTCRSTMSPFNLSQLCNVKPSASSLGVATTSSCTKDKQVNSINSSVGNCITRYEAAECAHVRGRKSKASAQSHRIWSCQGTHSRANDQAVINLREVFK